MRLRSRGSPTQSPQQKTTKKQKMKQKQKHIETKKGNTEVGRKRVKQQSPKKKTQGSRLRSRKSEKSSSSSPSTPKQKGRRKQKQEKQKNVSPPKNKKDQQKQKKNKAQNRQKSAQHKKAEKAKQKQEKNKGDSNQDQEKEQKKRKRQKSVEKQQQIQKIIVKGNIPIDAHFSGPKNVHVLQEGGKIYSATLNQTNVQNNNNKFYILQILQSDNSPDQCYFFTRWGRVGVIGQLSCVGPMNRGVAIRSYQKKYKDKYRDGDYREVEINYDDEEQKDDKQDKKDQAQKQSKKESTLSKAVQSLINLIFDLNMMNRHMKQIGYNVKKMPLGKLSKSNILKGYEILKQLSNEIENKNNIDVVNQLTNDFYSYIPHDFGFQKMSHFVLNTIKKVKDKLELLEALGEIKIATSMISDDTDENQIDANYKKLNRDITSIQKDTDQFKLIDKYLQTTHASTHSSYNLQLADLFSINDERENIRYTNHIDNKLLLWHGSRLTNFVGILSQGLRIAPPQAPVTGYMFGKGVYFADMSSKSANYCFTNRQNNTGILLLCQVACGNMNQKLHADYYASNLPDGKHSTKGVGKTAPPEKNYIKHADYMIPMGPAEPTDIAACYLQYNQYIVYDVAQIKIKYLLRTKFNYR